MQLLPFLGLALITSVCARTISINFWDNSASSADNNQVDPGETAGVIPVDGTHWNQIGFSHLNTSANLLARSPTMPATRVPPRSISSCPRPP